MAHVLERVRWRLRMLLLALRLRPIAGGDDPDPAKPDPAKPDPDPAKPDPDPDPAKPDPDPDPDPGKVTPDDDWKTKSRKHETAAKRERAAREKAEAELKKLRDKDKTEQERAVEKAREEGKSEALAEAEKERRGDRLETAVTRLASKGITLGEGDDAKTVKFADPEDALLRIERRIGRGELDADTIYDDEGRVKTEPLTEALAEIAGDNPHLVGQNGSPPPKADPDSRRGDPAQKDLESMTPEDHEKRKYGAKT